MVNCKECHYLKQYDRYLSERRRIMLVCSSLNVVLETDQHLPTYQSMKDLEIKIPFACPKRQQERMKGNEPSVNMR